MPRAIQHGAHKAHPLVLVYFGRNSGNDHRFVCDGCGCEGAGPRYRCDACDFDLHEVCATAPGTAWFFFHGQHPLAFEPAADDGARRCDICDTGVRGMHYRCRSCGFHVHPVCAHLPGAAVSPLHPEHIVMLGDSSWEPPMRARAAAPTASSGATAAACAKSTFTRNACSGLIIRRSTSPRAKSD